MEKKTKKVTRKTTKKMVKKEKSTKFILRGSSGDIDVSISENDYCPACDNDIKRECLYVNGSVTICKPCIRGLAEFIKK